MDVHNITQRSRNMSAIRGKDTKPELIVRRGLHAAGFRFRLHDRKLPGAPDIVLAKHEAAVFVHGCFWHGHDCALFRWPRTRQDFWREKITGNVERDRRAVERLRESGWRILIIWECALKGIARVGAERVTALASDWLQSPSRSLEISGERDGTR